MEELYNYDFNDYDIKTILELNPEIIQLNSSDIINKLDILKSLKCENRHIKNIVVSNPFYLSRCHEDILELIKKLKGIGLNTLNLLFDSNPWLLNKDSFEIEDFINKKINEGILLEDIVDMIDSNPYIIDEEN